MRHILDQQGPSTDRVVDSRSRVTRLDRFDRPRGDTDSRLDSVGRWVRHWPGRSNGWSPFASRIARLGLLLGFVVIGTGMGAIAGIVIAVLPLRDLAGLAQRGITSISVVLGFALGWWWASTMGARWLDDGLPRPRRHADDLAVPTREHE